MRIYLSHPFGGREENRERARAIQMFYEDIWAQERSDDDEFVELVNPLELLAGCAGHLDEDAITDAAVALMLSCDAVILCPGWEYSVGCTREFEAATEAGLLVVTLDPEVEEIAVGTYAQPVVREAVA